MNFNFSYFKICLILEIFIITIVESFTPVGRLAHASALVGTKLYFFGGTIGSEIYSNEVFYLDVSQTFNTELPPWTDLTAFAKIPFVSSWATVSLVDINNDHNIYLFGGIMQDLVSKKDVFASNVHMFNTVTLEWKMPYFNGTTPERRRDIHAVNDDTGNIYIFGGVADRFISSLTTKYFNNMVILKTPDYLWSYGFTPYAPSKRSSYSATLLKNGFIVYIGGQEVTEKRVVDINQINIYDTKSGIWSMMKAKNITLIESRYYHSAVLAPDGNNIIIYGGGKYDSGTIIKAEPDVAILNVQGIPFGCEWTTPTVSSNIVDTLPPLYAHTANLVGNYMIIAFGGILPESVNPSLNSKIYIMDTRNYTWIGTFETLLPPKTSNYTPTSSTSSTSTLTQSIGCMVLFFTYIVHGLYSLLNYQ